MEKFDHLVVVTGTRRSFHLQRSVKSMVCLKRIYLHAMKPTTDEVYTGYVLEVMIIQSADFSSPLRARVRISG
jgi:hypothetical protein